MDRIAGFAHERAAWLNLHAASIHYRRRIFSSRLKVFPQIAGEVTA